MRMAELALRRVVLTLLTSPDHPRRAAVARRRNAWLSVKVGATFRI